MYSYHYFNFIKNNMDKPWNWHCLSKNPMPLQKKLWAVEKIEDWWLNKIYSPDSNYVLGVIKPRFEKLCFTNLSTTKLN